MSSSAKLVYGISVDPFKLLYHARAWSSNHIQLAYLNGLISGKLHQDTSSRTALPSEILSMIKQRFWEQAIQDSTCECWAIFGNKPDLEIHRPSCCAIAYKAAEKYLSDRDSGICDGSCAYRSGESDASLDCDCAEVRADAWPELIEQETLFCEDAYWDERCEAENYLEGCFGKQCFVTRSICFRCRVLHPFLGYHGPQIGHYCDNVWSDDGPERRHGCIISLPGAEAPWIDHDLQGGSHTSIAALDPGILRALIDQNTSLEKLAKDLALPVMAHPFVQDNNASQLKKERKVKKEEGRQGSTLPDAALYKPRFHLIAGSLCDF